MSPQKSPSLNIEPEIPLNATTLGLSFALPPHSTFYLHTPQRGLQIEWAKLAHGVDCPRVSWPLEAEVNAGSKAMGSRLDADQSEHGVQSPWWEQCHWCRSYLPGPAVWDRILTIDDAGGGVVGRSATA